MAFERDVVIVGGCGHVGLPLGLAFADRGLNVVLFDINADSVAAVRAGRLPFDEAGAAEVLERVAGKNLEATADPASVSSAEHVVIVVGTPVDEHLNPDLQAVSHLLEDLAPHLRSGQLIVLRSTVYPGVTAFVERLLARRGVDVEVAFCPERLAQGQAMAELHELPQLVAGRHSEATARAEKLFRSLTDQILALSPEEAELAKLFTNTWRYIKFAIANQFFMIANDFGLDYERIRSAVVFDYPRAADMPSAGFAAGPCLLKDTMQLAAFNNNNFVLGQASMMINEGLPLYVVARLEQQYDLADMVVGILGMAFKPDVDDTRSSLSYKLKRILRFKTAEVLCTDPHVTTDDALIPLEEVLERADLLIVGTPHREYKDLAPKQPTVDIWGLLGNGVRV
jgi:UDP-N-acetyl-D-mannosaminuronic acid dehydrogenase